MNDVVVPIERAVLGYHSPILGMMWYVYDLLIIRLMYSLLRGKLSFFILIGLIGWFCCDYFGYREAMVSSNIWGGILFVGIGALYRRYENIFPNVRECYAPIFFAVIVVCVALLFAFSYYNGPVYMFTGYYGRLPILSIFTALCGIAIIKSISDRIGEVHPSWIQFVVAGAIPILGLHGRVNDVVTMLIPIVRTSDIVAIFISAIELVCFYPIIVLLDKYFPIVLGKRRYIERIKQ